MPQLTIRLPVVTGTDVYLRSLAGRLVREPADPLSVVPLEEGDAGSAVA